MQYMSLTTNVPVTNTKFEALKNSKEKDNHPQIYFQGQYSVSLKCLKCKNNF